MNSEPSWTPDRQTVRWWMGAADEDRIVAAITREVRQRGTGIRYDCDAYWQLAADVAMRLINDDMVTQAEDWIARKPESKRWAEQNEDEVIREWGVTSAAEAHRKFDFLTWVPDMETVRWWTGQAWPQVTGSWSHWKAR